MMWQVFLKKYQIEALATLLVGGILITAFVVSKLTPDRGPAGLTPDDYAKAAKIPKARCNCWDDVARTCLPLRVCEPVTP